jgi:uncharacterized caspase-like protein
MLMSQSTFGAGRAETKKVAIIVGNGAYVNTSSLPNPPNDAEKISSVLKSLGFTVHTLVNATKGDLQRMQEDMPVTLKKAHVGLFFYAGHGLQIDGENYIVPVDARFNTAGNVAEQLVSMNAVLSSMEAHTKVNLVFLDACRDNPFADALKMQMVAGRSLTVDGDRQIKNVGTGLAEMKASVGTLIAYATQPGNVAEDGQGNNSPFTTGILQNIARPGKDIREILTLVRVSVLNQTDGRQIPWDHSSLTEDFFFIEPVKPPLAPP